MARIVNDTMAESGDTTLASHTGETGATWTQHGGSANAATVIASTDTVVNAATGSALYYASAAPGSPDYYVAAQLRAVTAEADGIAGVVARCDTSATTFYSLVYYVVGGGLQVYRTVAGVATQLGSTYAFTPTVGANYYIRLEVQGTAVRAYLDGVEIISTTDTQITAAGRAGVLFNAAAGTATTGLHLDNIEAHSGGLWPPIFVGAGSFQATATSGASFSPGLPSGWAVGDLHILLTHVSSNADLGDPSGWTQFTPSSAALNNTTAQRVKIYWRIAVSGDTAPAVTGPANTIVRGGQIYGVRRWGGSLLDPFAASSRLNNAASATISTTNITPTEDQTLGLFLGAYEDDPTAGAQPTQGDWSVVTRAGSSLGSDMAVFRSVRLQYVAGSYATPTIVVSGGTFANSVNVGYLLAIRPTEYLPWAALRPPPAIVLPIRV